MDKKYIYSSVILIIILTGFFYKKHYQGEFFLVSPPLSWQLKSIYSDQKSVDGAKVAVSSLAEKLKTAKKLEERYDIYMGIAQYEQYLGDGKASYKTLKEAANLWPERGLAYMNAGVLMTRLYATSSAREFFVKAVEKDPNFVQGYFSLFDFYRLYDKESSFSQKDDFFRKALVKFNRDEAMLREYAGFLENEGKNEEALLIWQEVRELYRDDATSGVADKIKALEKKQQ